MIFTWWPICQFGRRHLPLCKILSMYPKLFCICLCHLNKNDLLTQVSQKGCRDMTTNPSPIFYNQSHLSGCICKQSDKWTDDNNHRFAKDCHYVFCSGQVDTFVSTTFFAIGEKKLIWCSVRYLSEIVNVHEQFVCIVREFFRKDNGT